ncbi:MAG: carbohydrate ABC transporter permease [Thermoproteota archaeon]
MIQKMPQIRSKSERIFNIAAYLAVAISVGIWLFPFYLLILISLRVDIFSWPPKLFPTNPDLSGYVTIFSHPAFVEWLMNSFVYTISISLGTVLIAAMTGYAFSRIDFPRKTQLFWIVLGLMMIPGIVAYIPLYVMLAKLKLLGTYWGIIIPPLASPYSAFLLKQAFDAIPRDYEESAYIDGASRFTIIFRVFIPLAKPALITLVLFQFVWNWNNFAWPLFVATSPRLWNLPLGIWNLTWSYTRDFWTLAAGGVVLMFVPFILYLIGIEYFLRGIIVTGLKK